MKSSVEKRFNALVQEYNQDVHNYVGRRLYPLSSGDLDDVVEETWIIIWRRIDSVPTESPLPWIIGVAKNVLRNSKRSGHRRSHYEAQVDPETTQPSAEEMHEAQSSIIHALRQLSDDDQEILTLSAWEGFSIKQIASMFSISENAVAVRITRAEQRLRTVLENSNVA